MSDGKNALKEEVWIKNLKAVKRTFDKIGIRYWLDLGTLLGAVRDGRFIEWDHDIDLGVMYENTNKITSLIKALENNGFLVNNFQPYLMNIFHRRRLPYVGIDVTLYHIKGNKAWGVWLQREPILDHTSKVVDQSISRFGGNLVSKSIYSILRNIYWKFFVPLRRFVLLRINSDDILLTCLFILLLNRRYVFKKIGGTKWRGQLYVIPRSHFKALGSLEFYGTLFNIPSNVEKYLEIRYGKDWRIPKKYWIPCRDDGAIAYNFDIPGG